MFFPNPQDMSLRLGLSLRCCLERSNYIKRGSLGWLTQSNWCLNKERLGTDTNTQASSHGHTGRESCKDKREASETSSPRTSVRKFWLPKWEENLLSIV